MEKYLAQDVPESERKQYLIDSCDMIDTKGFMKHYSQNELAEKKSELAETSIEIHEIAVQKKQAMDSFKLELKPLQEQKTDLLGKIKQRGEYVREDVYMFKDEQNKMACYYNASGELIEQRPLKPDEMQKSIFTVTAKTGTND
jgi:hypothetical protein